MPSGKSRLKPGVADRVTAGVGEPVAASWPGVNSTTVLLASFATHRLPEELKARPSGNPNPLLGPRMTFGTGEPVTASWLEANSTTVLLLTFATHRLPEELKAMAYGSSRLLPVVADRVAAGDGEPVTVSWIGVNSTTVLLRFATHRSPAKENARPCGSSRLKPGVADRVTAGEGSP